MSARASRAPGPGRIGALPGATGRRLPWRPPCFARVQAAAGPRLPPALAAARRLTSRPGGVRARPASPRPPARAGHAGAASPLAGPGRAAAARVMRPASALRPGRSGARGRQTARGHVTVAELSSGGDLCGGSRGPEGVPACLLGEVGLSEGFSRHWGPLQGLGDPRPEEVDSSAMSHV